MKKPKSGPSADVPSAGPRPKAPSLPEGPDVVFEEVPAGRETLTAISFDQPTRKRSPTKHYGDRISNAPGAMSPKASRALDGAPEIAVGVAAIGRRTQAIIDAEADDSPEIEVDGVPTSLPEIAALNIERISTFVIDVPFRMLDNERSRAVLLRSRLLPAIVGATLAHVTRFELRPDEASGRVVARVWTRVS